MKFLDEKLDEINSEIQKVSFRRSDRFTLPKLQFLLFNYSWLTNFPSPIPFWFKDIPLIYDANFITQLDSSKWYFRFVKSNFYFWNSIALPLTLYAQIAGIYAKHRSEIDYHNRRWFKWHFLASAIYYLFFIIIALNVLELFIVPFALLRIPGLFDNILGAISGLFVIIAMPISAILIPVFVVRFMGGIWNKHYIDSVCVREIIYILCDLEDDDLILNIEKKYSLQYRFQLFARCIEQLGQRTASTNYQSHEWTEKHFKQISVYVLERARWLSAPTETTLADLRKDFRTLASIFITEQYGTFAWKFKEVKKAPPALSERLNLAFVNIVRVIGFSIPIYLLWAYMDNPSILPNVPANPTAAGFLFVAWLFLSVDALFKLGLVRDLVSLAKGIKDIS